MSFDIMKQVETLGQNLLKLQDIDEQLSISLQKELSSLADQVPLLITLDSVSQLVKKDADLPIRRINYNIKKLSEDCKSRWIDLLRLDCEPLIFCMISFNGLASLPDNDFNWLLQKVGDYVENRTFPRYWILRDQIRKAVANTPRRDNTKQFIEKYHKAEMEWCNDSPKEKPDTVQPSSQMFNQDENQESNVSYEMLQFMGHESASSSFSRKRKTIQQMAELSTERRIENRYSEAPMTHDNDDRQEKIKLIKRSQEIDYKGSSMPANNLPRLIQCLPTAMESSKQWKWERQLFQDNVMRLGRVGADRTDCLSVFVPKDRSHDVSITLMVGHESGVALIDEMEAEIIRV